jgi:hypothetical protein
VLPGYTSINLQEIIAISAWYIWWTRRRITHGESISPVHQCAISIKGIALDSKVANKPNAEVKRVWAKPTCHKFKLNMDDAFNFEDRTGATGAILRDDHGVFLAAS